METKSYEMNEFNLKEICLVLLHRLWLILLIGSISAAAAGYISRYLLTPVYSSTTSVYVINRDDDNRLTFQDVQTGTQLTKDYMILVESRPVTEQVINQLKLNLTSDDLVNMVETETPEDTRILRITVNYPDAGMAKKIADTIAAVSAERMVSIMEMEKVNIIEPGNLPVHPTSPDFTKNVAIGAMIGLAFASMIITFRYLLNDTIKSAEDIERYLGLTNLSSIPVEDANSRRRKAKTRREIKQNKEKTALAG